KQNDQPERTKHRQRRVAQRIVGDAPLKQGKSEYIRHTHRQAESEHRSAEDHPRERPSHTIWVAWSPGSSCNEYEHHDGGDSINHHLASRNYVIHSTTRFSSYRR